MYIIDTDVCEYQLGFTLLQEEEDDVKHTIRYWSQSLNKAEKNYSTTKRECLAVVWATLWLRPYLEGDKLTLRKYHAALRWALKFPDSSCRLPR